VNGSELAFAVVVVVGTLLVVAGAVVLGVFVVFDGDVPLLGFGTPAGV
jgi:hypothetical protein